MVEIRGIQSSEVPAPEVRTPQVLAGIFLGEPLRRASKTTAVGTTGITPKEKPSQGSEVMTTGIINQLDSAQLRDNFESFLPIYC